MTALATLWVKADQSGIVEKWDTQYQTSKTKRL